jgi:hypothetical protein
MHKSDAHPTTVISSFGGIFAEFRQNGIVSCHTGPYVSTLWYTKTRVGSTLPNMVTRFCSRNSIWTRLRLRRGFGLGSDVDSIAVWTRFRSRLGFGSIRLGYNFDSNGHDFYRFPAKIVINSDGCAKCAEKSPGPICLTLSLLPAFDTGFENCRPPGSPSSDQSAGAKLQSACL